MRKDLDQGKREILMTRKRNEREIVVSSGAAAAPVRRKSPAHKKSAAAMPETPSNLSAAPAVESVTPPAPAEIAVLAYSYWADRGYQGGSPEEDWLRAEQELRVATLSLTA
jgi:hypothetical protein